MEKQARKGSNNWVITVESRNDKDQKIITILSMTTHSMIVFRSHARHAGEVGGGPDVASVHLFPEEIDTTKTNVNGVDGLLHVQVPKKNHRNSA